MSRKTIDMSGWVMKEHGVPESRVTVIKINDEYKKEKGIKKKEHYWDCVCECGKHFTTGGYNLRSGQTLSCGCLRDERSRLDTIRRVKEGHLNRKNLVGVRSGKLLVLKDTGERVKDKGEVLWLCRCDCGNFTKVKTSHLIGKSRTLSCGCLVSKGENKIKDILVKNNIPFIKQKTYDDLRSPNVGGLLKYDFYINDEFLLEYDGEQHFKESSMCNDTLEERQAIDKLKNDYAKAHNIPIKRIPYWDYKKITLDTIMDDTWTLSN